MLKDLINKHGQEKRKTDTYLKFSLGERSPKQFKPAHYIEQKGIKVVVNSDEKPVRISSMLQRKKSTHRQGSPDSYIPKSSMSRPGLEIANIHRHIDSRNRPPFNRKTEQFIQKHLSNESSKVFKDFYKHNQSMDNTNTPLNQSLEVNKKANLNHSVEPAAKRKKRRMIPRNVPRPY